MNSKRNAARKAATDRDDKRLRQLIEHNGDAQSPEYNKAVWQMVLDEALKISDLARRMLKGAQ